MDQREGRTTAARLSLKRKLEAADFEDQNQGGRKLLVIEDGNKDGTAFVSFTRQIDLIPYICLYVVAGLSRKW